MELFVLEPLQIEQYYKELFEKVFGFWEPNQRPENVLIGMDDEGGLIGFSSGMYTHASTFHIQYAGVLPEQRGQNYSDLLSETEKNFPATLYTANVINNNLIPQIALLNQGYVIYGVRVHNGILVQFKKEIADGTVRTD